MEITIKVFVEGKVPTLVNVNEKTNIQDILKELKIKTEKVSAVYFSDKSTRPSVYASLHDDIYKEVNDFPRKSKLVLRGKCLWIGFYPKKNEIKYDYHWVGNTKTKISEAKAHEDFVKRARYVGNGMYDTQGIKANDTRKLFELYVEAMNYELL